MGSRDCPGRCPSSGFLGQGARIRESLAPCWHPPQVSLGLQDSRRHSGHFIGVQVSQEMMIFELLDDEDSAMRAVK
jgi:hypothetical protein